MDRNRVLHQTDTRASCQAGATSKGCEKKRKKCGSSVRVPGQEETLGEDDGEAFIERR